jgi:hypothetical protein
MAAEPQELQAYKDEKAYSDEYRQWAYQLWAFVYARNVTAVTKHLQEPKEGDPFGAQSITSKTIRNWIDRENWPSKLATDMKMIAPDMHGAVVTNLLTSALKFSEFLADLAHDRVPLTNSCQIGAAKMKLEGTKIAFDRSGFMPWEIQKDRQAAPAPTRPQDYAVANLSNEEIRDRMLKVLGVKEKEL